MKVRDVMNDRVIGIGPQESVAVAARTLAQYNIGVLPVRGENGKLCGVVTDRDLVTRCVAANRNPETTCVKTVMTKQVVSVSPEMDTSEMAALMGRKQIKRMPVVQQGMLCGMVSLSDLNGNPMSSADTTNALAGIWSNITKETE